MSILEELNLILDELKIPCATGIYKAPVPKEYAVFVPLADSYPLNGNDMPLVDLNEVRISFFTKGNYRNKTQSIVRELLHRDFTITDRKYVDYEESTGYHHYAIEVAKLYEMEE